MPPGDTGNDTDPNAYPFEFDQRTPGGIDIETRGHSIPALADIDNWYRQAQECVKAQYEALSFSGFIEYDAPPIIIEDDLTNLCGSGSAGIYCTNYTVPFVGIQAGYADFAYRETWRHEFIHHILFMNDFDHDLNLNHQPSQIWQCQSYDN